MRDDRLAVSVQHRSDDAVAAARVADEQAECLHPIELGAKAPSRRRAGQRAWIVP